MAGSRYGAFVPADSDRGFYDAVAEAEAEPLRRSRRLNLLAFVLGFGVTLMGIAAYSSVRAGAGRRAVDVASGKKKGRVPKVGHPTLGPPLYNRSATLGENLVGASTPRLAGTAITVGPLELRWETDFSEGHTPKGFHCTAIKTVVDATPSQTWNDNFICASIDLHLKWSLDGPVDGMRCTRVADPKQLAAAPSAGRQHLCIPYSIPFDLVFTQKLDWGTENTDPLEGIQAGYDKDLPCLNLLEPHDHASWGTENYLCVVYAAAALKGGESFGGLSVDIREGRTLAECSDLCRVSPVRCSWFEYQTTGVDQGKCWLKNGVKGSRHILHGHIYGVPFRCGDGMTNTVDELCDDGNDRDGDGCSAECQPEDGYSCTRQADEPSVCRHVAQCTAPYMDRCACGTDMSELFCAGRFSKGELAQQSDVIYDFYTCQACCAEGVHECALSIAKCPAEMKPLAQACNRKCLALFGGSQCPDGYELPWWDRQPVARRSIAGAFSVLSSDDERRDALLTRTVPFS